MSNEVDKLITQRNEVKEKENTPSVAKSSKIVNSINYLIRRLKEMEILIVLINLIAIAIIVPIQSRLTSNHDRVFADYRSIRFALTALRINHEYTYDICGDLAVKKSSPDKINQELDMLRTKRFDLLSNLISVSMGMDESFDQKSYKEISQFIKFTDAMNTSEGEAVCHKELMSGSQLLSWEKSVLGKMHKSI